MQVRDSVPLTLYSNGILMFGGPFRPYSDPVTQVSVYLTTLLYLTCVYCNIWDHQPVALIVLSWNDVCSVIIIGVASMITWLLFWMKIMFDYTISMRGSKTNTPREEALFSWTVKDTKYKVQ